MNHPPEASRPLVDATIRPLRAFFAANEHNPSAEHWEALRAIAETMDDMANDRCPREVSLSAVDPGLGKSQTVAHFARALVASADHQRTGMVICVGRLTEAEAMVRSLGLPADRVAVLTSDVALNALGGAPVHLAQVLVTTQQRIERDARTSFSTASGFFYLGCPRQVRVWDEAWLPGVAVTLGQDDLLFLPKLVRPFSPACADAIGRFALGLGARQSGDLVDVPDFEKEHDISLADVLASAIGATGRLRDDQQAAATALMVINGKTVGVLKEAFGRTEETSAATVLTYHDTLPADLLPLLVLDASGRVRDTYRQIEQHRGNLRRLPSAIKDYSPLTVHTWRLAGSKTGFERHGVNLVKGITDTIKTKPNERWLVVLHKESRKVGNIADAIRRQLPAVVADNVATITWGQHMATNAYADVPNVILAGTLFMRESFYVALTHLAQDRPIASGFIARDAVVRTMRGEHANLVLQAVCRGRVRKSDGAKCKAMSAFIIASPKSGIPNDIPSIFPGCRVVDWNAKETAARGYQRAVAYIQSALASGETWVAQRTVAAALKMDPRNFRKRVLRRPEFQAALAGLQLVTARGPKGAVGFRPLLPST